MNFTNLFRQSVTVTSYTDIPGSSREFIPLFYTPSQDCPASLLHMLACAAPSSNSFFTISSRPMDCVLLVHTLSGQGKLRSGKQTLDLPAGSLLLLDCERPFTLQPSILPWKSKLYFLDRAGLSTFCSILFPGNQPLIHEPGTQSPIPHYISMLSGIPEHYLLSDAFFMHRCLTDLFCTLIQNTLPQTDEDAQKTPHYLSDMKRRLEKNYDQPFQLSDFEQHYKISKYRLCREFSARFGKPPLQFLNQIRLNHAKEMLLTTDLSIHEISSLVGYENPTHFINLFKKYNGTTPGAFRKNCRSSR
ncbi:MAG: AraC family transcriptional regulator [Lachnospiraceae bacterium]|nr:AraC family transcriptional regulator [Lachnospiraceae bacterium]MDY4969506.1 AraC family transcriptional regulator [Lachnospiraceae bacterium]